MTSSKDGREQGDVSHGVGAWKCFRTVEIQQPHCEAGIWKGLKIVKIPLSSRGNHLSMKGWGILAIRVEERGKDLLLATDLENVKEGERMWCR